MTAPTLHVAETRAWTKQLPFALRSKQQPACGTSKPSACRRRSPASTSSRRLRICRRTYLQGGGQALEPAVHTTFRSMQRQVACKCGAADWGGVGVCGSAGAPKPPSPPCSPSRSSAAPPLYFGPAGRQHFRNCRFFRSPSPSPQPQPVIRKHRSDQQEAQLRPQGGPQPAAV